PDRAGTAAAVASQAQLDHPLADSAHLKGATKLQGGGHLLGKETSNSRLQVLAVGGRGHLRFLRALGQEPVEAKGCALRAGARCAGDGASRERERPEADTVAKWRSRS